MICLNRYISMTAGLESECYHGAQEVPRLTEALGNNESLKELIIKVGCEEDEDVWISMFELVPGLCCLLRGNQALSKLTLRLYHQNGEAQHGSEIISRIFQAANGHASLRHLTFDIWTQLRDDAAEAIGNILRTSPALRELTMRDVSVEPAALCKLALGLQDTNSTLKKLDLSRGNSDVVSGEFDSVYLGDLLIGSNPSLKSLTLIGRGIGDRGACALAEALKQNHVLEELDLCDNNIRDEGAVAIAGAVLTNRSLKSIEFGIPLAGGLSVETETAILKAAERNTTLERFRVHDMRPKTSDKVDYLLRLNLGGRRILSSKSDVPLNYWPLNLANSSKSADVLFFFLREKNDVLIPRVCA